jgi:hypothetical protein
MENRRGRINSIVAALCIASSLAAALTGCDKIGELRNSLSRGSGRRAQARGQERPALTERRAQAVTGLQQTPSQDMPLSNGPLANDIAARSVIFAPGLASDASGVLKATFDNTFAIPADVAVMISVDGTVVANQATRVPPESRWSYSAPYTFTSSGEHALRMGAYLKGGMPMPEADMTNNEASGVASVAQGAAGLSAAAAAVKNGPQASGGDAAQTMDLNDIEAHSIGFMPDDSTKYTSQTVVGKQGVIRTTFSNGFNYDANLRVRITDGEKLLSDVMLAVPRRSQGAYFVKHIFDSPGMHKITLGVYQAETAYQERNSINNEMTAVINVTAPAQDAAVNNNSAPSDVAARSISFQPEGAPAASNTFETGTLGRVRLDYTSTFMANIDLAISWFIDGNLVAETPVKNVSPGDHYSLMGYTFDAPGTHTIAAEIKLAGDGKIEEPDIQNNRAEAQVEAVLSPEPQRVAPVRNAPVVLRQPQTQAGGFSMVEPINLQIAVPSAVVSAAEPAAQQMAAPVAVQSMMDRPAYDMISGSIVFIALPGNRPVASASAGQGGSISYTVKNRNGPAGGVEVKVRLELEGKAVFSLAKKIDIPDSGVFKGETGNLVLSKAGRYKLYLSAYDPNNPSGRSFELKRSLDVLPRAN